MIDKLSEACSDRHRFVNLQCILIALREERAEEAGKNKEEEKEGGDDLEKGDTKPDGETKPQ